MKKLILSVASLLVASISSLQAQVPISQIEGFLEVYLPQDTTSMYIGWKSGQKVSSAAYNNVFLGSQAGLSNDNGRYNVFVGSDAGRGNIFGEENVFVGTRAGSSNISGNSNSYFGSAAGALNKNGSHNVFVGKEAGVVELGSKNTYVGSNAGRESDSTSHNSFFGYRAGEGATGSNNTYVGANAGDDAGDGEQNTVVGYEAGDENEGSNNVLVGSFSGDANIGDENTFVGSYSGKDNEGSENTFVGFRSGEKNEADGNAFVGFQSGKLNTTGKRNAFYGANAGQANSLGSSNTFMGWGSGKFNSSGGGNVFVGTSAGENSKGSYQSFMGWQAGRYSRSGSNSVVIGTSAGLIDTAIINSVYIGYSAGQLGPLNPTSRQGNVFIGNYAGYDHEGSNHLFISNSSVDSTEALIYGEFDNGGLLRVNGDLQIAPPTAGVNSRLLMIGIGGVLNEVIKHSTSDNDVVIGNVTGTGGKLHLRSSGTTKMSIIENGNVGIGTTAPTQKLHVNGNARFTDDVFADNLETGSGTHDLRWNSSTGRITSSTSDVRLKDNVKTIIDALDKVMHLRGVSFNWKEMPDGRPQLGLIAQEVKEVIPEVVSMNKNGYYGVDYSETIGVFVEAIKEQQSMIEGQQNEITELRLLLNKALFQIERINDSLSTDTATSLD